MIPPYLNHGIPQSDDSLELSAQKAVGNISQSAPPLDAAAVTPSDSSALAAPARSLYIGVTGDVKVDLACAGKFSGVAAAAVVFKAVPVGFLNVQVSKVYNTGTTATNIVALYP